MKVVDIPADLLADASEPVADVQKPEGNPAAEAAAPVEEKKVPEVPAPEVVTTNSGENVEQVAPAIPADVEKIESSGEKEDGERPNFFGFRIPTVVILRRPVFDDPFSFFPFSAFNRRPAVDGPPRRVETRDGMVPPPSAVAAPTESRPVNVGGGGAGISGTYTH